MYRAKKMQNRAKSNSSIKIRSIVTSTPFNIYGKDALILQLCHTIIFPGKNPSYTYVKRQTVHILKELSG